jgi:hypothetical protein
MTVLQELQVKFSSDRGTFHLGLLCLYMLSILSYYTKEMFRELTLFPIPVKEAVEGPVLEN